MCQKTDKFESFLAENLARVLNLETKNTLGDRNTYIGASDIGGCPYKIVKSKQNPPVYSLKQQIIFQRGHLAENLVSKMLDGLDVVDQFEVLGQLDQIQLKAHLDKLIMSKSRCVIVEVKTVSAPTEEPYESWVYQVQFQMGLLQQQEECDHEVEAYVLALDLNTGWMKTFNIEFDDYLFETCLGKAQHIEDAMSGHVEPKAIIQNYCSTCPFKMECPKQGAFAEDLPEDIKADLVFIKEAKAKAKESKARENRVKNYLVNMGVKLGKDACTDTVVTVKEQKTSRFDTEAFKLEHPELYEKYLNSSSAYRMNII